MIITDPPAPWLYFAMTVISVAAGAAYFHEYFYLEPTAKNLIVALVWTTMAFIWMYSFFQNRKKAEPAVTSTQAPPEPTPEQTETSDKSE